MKKSTVEINRSFFTEGRPTLDEVLEEIQVQEVDEYINLSNGKGASLTGWFTVVDTQGIIAYFSTETEALNYRLNLINRILN